jgi:hypothetical protein
MITIRSLQAATLVAAALLSCMTAAADELPAPDTVRARLKTVAVMPVKTPTDLPGRAEAEQRLEQAL